MSKKNGLSVVISGMPSVGKTTAADAIARRFHFNHIAGGDMLKEMAIERGYSPSGSDWWDSPQGMRFLSERKTNPDFDREVDRRLIEYLKTGGVVITSYTVPWICPSGLKIWFSATQKNRAKRLAGRDGISFAEALKIVRSRDSLNRNLYSKIYGIRFGTDLSVFNYIIKTDDLTAQEVATAACHLVQLHTSQLGRTLDNVKKRINMEMKGISPEKTVKRVEKRPCVFAEREYGDRMNCRA